MNLERLSEWRRSLGSNASQSLWCPPVRWRAQVIFWGFSFALGLGYAFLVVGPRVLNPLDLSWLVNDSATAYLGWGFFRQEPHLTLPLGWSEGLGYPLGESIAYLDSIPLLASICWLIRGILPDNFQYLGLYFALCCVLQFYFGFRISRRLCNGDNIGGILGGCLFLIAPPFTWRAFDHFALISHWFILAALDQLLSDAGRPSRTQIAWRGVICFVAGGVNPYIAMMTFLILSGAYLRAVLLSRGWIARSCAGLGVALCSALLGLMLFGFLRTGDVSQYAGAGYEKYSMNLLSPIDPGRFGALLLKQQPSGAGQYEGYNYLGLGVLLAAIVAVARRPSSLRSLSRAETIPTLGVFFISLLLSLSSLGKAGNLTLWQLTLPHPIVTALASLRCSGRLFWPGYYLLFAGIIAAMFRAFSRRWSQVAMGAVLLIQILDVASLPAAIRHHWNSSAAPLISSEVAWHDLGKTQRHLVIVPAWQCSGENSPGGQNSYAIFGRLALEQHMTINSFYPGRLSRAQTEFYCGEQMMQIRETGLRNDAAYVFDRDSVSELVGLQYGGKYCRYVDEFILCSQVAGQSGLDPAVWGEVVTLRTGEAVPFSALERTADRLVVKGWSGPEPGGRWMRGHSAVMLFKVAVPQRRDVRIELSVLPFVAPSRPLQRVDVSANGEALQEKAFSASTGQTLNIVIPARLIRSDGWVRLVFNLPDAFSPASIGMNGDQRELSIYVQQLRVEDDGN
jgi:Family of unknown function (DUF6311)